MSSDQKPPAATGLPADQPDPQKAAAMPMDVSRMDVADGFQIFDAEYHAAEFCVCCLPGE